MRICNRLVRKGAYRIKQAMGGDANKQALGFVINHHKRKTDGNGLDHLQKIGQKLCARAVDQIDDMPDAKGQA